MSLTNLYLYIYIIFKSWSAIFIVVMLLLSHISIKLWSIRSIGNTSICSVHLVYSVLFDPLRFNSIQFGSILSIFVPFGPPWSYSFYSIQLGLIGPFGLFGPLRFTQSISILRSIWSTSVHFYTSVHFSLIQSNSVHSVPQFAPEFFNYCVWAISPEFLWTKQHPIAQSWDRRFHEGDGAIEGSRIVVGV